MSTTVLSLFRNHPQVLNCVQIYYSVTPRNWCKTAKLAFDYVRRYMIQICSKGHNCPFCNTSYRAILFPACVSANRVYKATAWLEQVSLSLIYIQLTKERRLLVRYAIRHSVCEYEYSLNCIIVKCKFLKLATNSHGSITTARKSWRIFPSIVTVRMSQSSSVLCYRDPSSLHLSRIKSQTKPVCSCCIT